MEHPLRVFRLYLQGGVEKVGEGVEFPDGSVVIWKPGVLPQIYSSFEAIGLKEHFFDWQGLSETGCETHRRTPAKTVLSGASEG